MRPALSLLTLVTLLAAVSALLLVVAALPERPVLLLWGLLLLAAFLDLALTLPFRAMTLTASLPASGFVGQAVALVLTIQGRRLPPQLPLRLDHDPGLHAPDTVVLRPEGPKVTQVVAVQVTRRGPHRITRASVLYASRLRLFDMVETWPLDLALTGLPDVSQVLSGAIQTRMLPLLEGMHQMNRRGEGSEFHQLREFMPGMDSRQIDWKRSARTRHLVARETRAERNHQIILCLDTGHLMAERLGALSKLDHAIHAALALTWAAALAGDNVGFYSFGPRPQTLLPPAPGRSAFAAIRAAAAVLVQDQAETNHTLGLTTLNGRLKRRSLVIVFSDFADSVTAELLVENLGVLQRQHLILYIALRDPVLHQLAAPAQTAMTDIARAVAARRLLHDRHIVLDRLARLGVLCLDTTPTQLTAALVSRYVDIKAREMI